MVVKTAAELTALAARILVAAGASQENAATVADPLVRSNLSGVDTHGVWNLPGYVAGLRAGDILVPGDPESRTRTVRLRDGIPIPEDTWRSLEQVAASLGITEI